MNEMEKQIEEVNNENEELFIEEDKTEKREHNNDKNKKIIIIILIAVVLIAALTVLALTLLNNNDNNNNEDNENDAPVNDTLNDEPVSKEEDAKEKLGYVTCDDNTSLLNVRNSTSGDIIDGLSCFKEVTIEEELEGTENCAKWYKISYKKRGSNYTGYSCATYIKEDTITKEVKNTVRDLIDKANNYYDNNLSKAYCGKTNGTKEIEFTTGENVLKGEYLKSEYKSLEELKKYLISFMDENVLKTKLELSDINNPKYLDNYYEIDGNLYCRNYSAEGNTKTYTGNYDIEITSNTDTKIIANISYEHLTSEAQSQDKCNINNLSSCTNGNFKYEIGKIEIVKKNNNYIITKLDFHK